MSDLVVLAVDPEQSHTASGLRVKFALGGDSCEFHLRSMTAGIELRASGDTIFPALLPLALHRAHRMDLNGLELSESIRTSEGRIRDIYRGWDCALHSDALEIENFRLRSSPPVDFPKKRACFFTAGVDSFHTLFENIDDIDTLIHVYGLDTPLEREDLIRTTRTNLARIADYHDLELIELQTDIRRVYRKYGVDWITAFFPIIAGVAHSLESYFDRIYFSSYGRYPESRPSPEVPAFRGVMDSDTLAIELFGEDASRLEKLAYICRFDMARRYLKACNRSVGNRGINCGFCEKCIRTRLELLAIGKLDEVESYDSELEPERVARVEVGPYVRVFFKEIAEELERDDRHPEFRRAIEKALRGGGPMLRMKRSVKRHRLYRAGKRAYRRIVPRKG